MKALKSQKPHIGIFGRRNVGKSSFINALTGQEIAIVSEHAGTTTDPVTKTMEIFGIGPVVMTDTAGIDDVGDLGQKRVARTITAMDSVDLGVILIAEGDYGEHERRVATELTRRETPFFVVQTKSDLSPLTPAARERIAAEAGAAGIAEFSSQRPAEHFDKIVELLRRRLPESSFRKPSILGDLVSPGDLVVLVMPIDAEAPEGRIILPQVQAVRDCLDNHCVAAVLQAEELAPFIERSSLKPRLVVTDSQAFRRVSAAVPQEIALTSFSILFSRLKGDFGRFLQGTPAISRLRDGDRVLILESCTHHVVEDDIGREKLPRWLSEFTGKRLAFDVTAGADAPPRPIGEYGLVVQCGGCMLTRKQVLMRLRPSIEAGVPVTNYGMAIAWCLGIYDRAVAPLTKACTPEP